MNWSEEFPDLYRYMKTEASPSWLLAAGSTIQAITICWLFSRPNNAATYTTLVFWQSIILYVYGTVLASQSIVKEMQARTWDAYRLTPLTAREAVIGRLLGAPLRAWFLWAMLLPWMIISSYAPYSGVSSSWVLKTGQMISMALLLQTTGLLFSAHATRDTLMRGGIIGVFLGFLAVQTSLMFERGPATIWYGFSLYPEVGRILFSLFFAAWAFLGVCWKLGEEFLDQRGGWRAPVFLLTSGVFMNGFTRSWLDLPTAVTLGGALVLFVSAAINPTGPDEWRLAWGRRPISLESIPFWIPGLASYAILLVMCAADPRGASQPVMPRLVIALSWIGFAARDLCLLQWFRLGKGRAPEMTAFIYIVLLYVVPTVILPHPTSGSFGWRFLPLFEPSAASPLALAPAWGMATVAVALVYSRSAALLKATSSR